MAIGEIEGVAVGTTFETWSASTLVPGAQGIIHDTALRGIHHQTLLRNLGLLPVNRVTAKK